MRPLEQKMNIKAKSTSSSREAALARRRAMSSMGKQAIGSSAPERTRGGDRTRAQAAPAASPSSIRAAASAPAASASSAPTRVRAGSVVATPGSAARQASRARRAALSQSGRRAMTSNDRVRDGAPRGKAPAESVERKHTDQGGSASLVTELGIAVDPVRMDSQAKYGTVARGDAEVYIRIPTIKGRRELICRPTRFTASSTRPVASTSMTFE